MILTVYTKLPWSFTLKADAILLAKTKTQKIESVPFVLKDYSTPLIIAGIVFLGILVGLIPQIKDIFAIRAEITTLSKSLQALDQKHQALTSLSDSELNSMVSVVESALPSDKPIFQAIEVVQARAFEYGLKVDSFDFSPGSVASESASSKNISIKNASGISAMDLEVTILGTFENLLRFVRALENSGPLTEVQGFSVSSAAAFENEVKTTITLKIFYMAPPASIGSVTSPLKLMTQEQVSAIENLSAFVKTTPSSISPLVGGTLRENPFSF